eukprot:921610_1
MNHQASPQNQQQVVAANLPSQQNGGFQPSGFINMPNAGGYPMASAPYAPSQVPAHYVQPSYILPNAPHYERQREQSREPRTPRPRCNYCRMLGHYEHDCWQNPDSPKYKPQYARTKQQRLQVGSRFRPSDGGGDDSEDKRLADLHRKHLREQEELARKAEKHAERQELLEAVASMVSAAQPAQPAAPAPPAQLPQLARAPPACPFQALLDVDPESARATKTMLQLLLQVNAPATAEAIRQRFNDGGWLSGEGMVIRLYKWACRLEDDLPLEGENVGVALTRLCEYLSN